MTSLTWFLIAAGVVYLIGWLVLICMAVLGHRVDHESHKIEKELFPWSDVHVTQTGTGNVLPMRRKKSK